MEKTELNRGAEPAGGEECFGPGITMGTNRHSQQINASFPLLSAPAWNEKMKGKNKLVPRLLGITKESVMRVDERTKEVIQEWSLTNIKRWAASPKSFTLDFGDYQDGYYSVQTTEGEQIAQLIAGYIDIILKKKKSKDHFGLEGDEESTMLEDSVSPKK
ncbi:Talin-1 [Ataeniobius toweri]|uniref:Talin-1 n=1 Tax=Ataeniobius toweri TaxID=208326 RepID=A0ABU7C8I5_9TELE|nr:Talin-1 [Ataeniobius toweri]